MSDSCFGFLRKGPLGFPVRRGRRKGNPFERPGVSITSSQAAAVVFYRGRCLPGLSGNI